MAAEGIVVSPAVMAGYYHIFRPANIALYVSFCSLTN